MKAQEVSRQIYLPLLSVIIGVVAGLGAVAFRGMIAFFHNLMFLGDISFVYDANIHTPPSPWGVLVIFVPVIGSLGVTWLAKSFVPEVRGSGVPDVIESIFYRRGIIHPALALVKSLASAISIGSGSSVGREGPIIEIGSSLASGIGQIIPISVQQRLILVAAGAGAGVAATFNAPIGGILFAIEIMLHEISVQTLVPVAIAAATATYTSREILGDHPSFIVPELQPAYFPPNEVSIFLTYVGMGLLMGAVAILFIKSRYAFEELFQKRLKINDYLRHALGVLPVGIMFYLLMLTSGHYHIQGVGYATIQDVLAGRLVDIRFLILLFFLKLLAVSLSIGSGASGGIFSPGLFMGATLGMAYGLALKQFFPAMPINPPAYAIAGMAGVVGGATGAAITTIVMIFEMTLDYNVIIPLTVTVALSFGIRKIFSPESIYTRKLGMRGHRLPESHRAYMHELEPVRTMMQAPPVWLPAETTLNVFISIAYEHKGVEYFLIDEEGKFIGLVSAGEIFTAWRGCDQEITLDQFASREYILVSEDITLFELASQMRDKDSSVALVVKKSPLVYKEDITGLVTKQEIADSVAEAMELFRD